MAEETQKPPSEEVVVVVEKQTTSEEKPVVVQSKTAEELVAVVEKPTEGSPETAEKITESVSFKEETNVVDDLPDPEKKALADLKLRVEEALKNHEFTAPPPPPAEEIAVVVEAETVAEKAETPAPIVTEEAKIEEKAETVTESEPEIPKIEAVSKIDEDGAKTVEAIEETIVAVTPSSTEEAPPAEVAPETAAEEEVRPPPPQKVSIWGIPLLEDTEKSDVILLKFLRARDFKVKEAFTMLKNAVLWRETFGIESLLESDLEKNDLEKVVFTHGLDKEGHPVCYNVYGEFQDKELYDNNFSDEEKRLRFLKWRIQFLEKSIRKLEFSPNGVCTIVQVNDLRNSPGPHRRELRQTTKQAVQILQDNYPEFVAKQVFVNVPWWYLPFKRMISPILTPRASSKFVFAGPSRTADTLFKYIAPEQVPVQYGGLSREGEQEFTVADSTTEVTIKPATTHPVEIPVSETCTLVWELRVVGWEVSYGAEFVPDAEDGYTVIVQKSRKISPTDEKVISNSFKIGEPGKVVLTINNQSSKKKKLLYRFKTKSSSD